MIEPNFEFLHGRTTKKEIIIPESWEEDIDMELYHHPLDTGGS